ncbi:hypothetical protein FisN_6Hh396 [Fistulifera solaris]|uniref:Glutathione peroxidase n=1 Tax=Fistulifera solaris TaxID=1519565 RepID=A0A1Z5KFD0_FISSO|nr:hypothetical protein FisN_6Hh396 [Fistulifera solaris]|eukprot:GAX24835.1 hypothetical protein FisN_6Hh396 [Fistulifera solaris]
MMKKALFAVQDATTRVLYGKEKQVTKMSFYDCVDRRITGEEVKMGEFAGNFGAQEPGTPEEILAFVKKFDPDMDKKLVFFEKADVNGANAREPYSFVKKVLPGSDGSADIRWNFVGKFLIDHEGTPVERSGGDPFELKDSIEKLLQKKEASAK